MSGNNLSIDNLSYEELVLLQEIMMDVLNHGMASGHADYDIHVFDSLYEKILTS